jgi:eukaryotic-like serine/threonine-protein kinase
MRKLAGRYRVEEPIGLGGTAVVWRAHDLFLGRDVAIKTPLAEILPDRENVAVLTSEARLAAQLSHPNVAVVHDCGYYRRRGRRLPYLVMELLDGPTLAAALDSGLPPSTGEMMRVFAQVAAALAAAHAKGVVHRDIKPANIVLTASGVKIVDFGIATTEKKSHGARPRGTPAYMAPEQLAHGTVSAAADMYAFGVSLYRCLTGRLPWTGSNLAELVAAREAGLPPIPDLPGVDPEVIRLCLECLDNSPQLRPSSRKAARILGEQGFDPKRLDDRAFELAPYFPGVPQQPGFSSPPPAAFSAGYAGAPRAPAFAASQPTVAGGATIVAPGWEPAAGTTRITYDAPLWSLLKLRQKVMAVATSLVVLVILAAFAAAASTASVL